MGRQEFLIPGSRPIALLSGDSVEDGVAITARNMPEQRLMKSCLLEIQYGRGNPSRTSLGKERLSNERLRPFPQLRNSHRKNTTSICPN